MHIKCLWQIAGLHSSNANVLLYAFMHQLWPYHDFIRLILYTQRRYEMYVYIYIVAQTYTANASYSIFKSIIISQYYHQLYFGFPYIVLKYKTAYALG